MRVISLVLVVALGALRDKVYGSTTKTTGPPNVESSKDSTGGYHADATHGKGLTLNSGYTKGKDDRSASFLSRPKRSYADFSRSSQSLTPDQYYMKLMSMLTSKENSFHSGNSRFGLKEGETDFVDDDDEGEVIELYGSNPYPFTSIEVTDKKPRQDKTRATVGDTISLMRSRPPLDQVGEVWDDSNDIHYAGTGRRQRVTRTVTSGNRNNPYERRIFTRSYQPRPVRRSFTSFFG